MASKGFDDDAVNSPSTTSGVGGQETSSGIKDRRVRLSPKPSIEAMDLVLGKNTPDNILNPLRETAGLMFPYTPNINEATSVNYDMYDLTHTNQPIAAFKNVAAKEIQISGIFTAQNDQEGRYCLAAMHFLRTVTKMYFGARENSEATNRRGTPPPILMFNGYGTAIYHNVPVIVTNCIFEFPNDVDYINVQLQQTATRTVTPTVSIEDANGNITKTRQDPVTVTDTIGRAATAWVPTKFNISMTLQVQNTPNRLRKFDLDKFRKGDLLDEGGWI